MIPEGAAAFLDRDGTIMEDRDYLSDPEGVQLLPGAARAVRRLNEAGIPVLVVTNQSGIGRGYFTEAEYRQVHQRFVRVLADQGATVTATYHCPHAPDRQPPCECRKPRAGLFEAAAREHGVVLSRSLHVGDRVRDLMPGLAAGAGGYLIRSDKQEKIEKIPERVRLVESLEDAVDHWLNALSGY